MGVQDRRRIIESLLLCWFPIRKLEKVREIKIRDEHVTNPGNHKSEDFAILGK